MSRLGVLSAFALLALGCSADAAPEPEPELDTPGAFVAVSDGQGQYDVLRTLAGLEVGAGQDLLFLTVYSPPARDFEHARELARDPALVVRDSLALVPKERILATSWEVVWFRTLTDEERAALP